MRIIGYGICGAGEADRYLKGTLDCFNKFCDDTIIVLNNAGQKEIDLIAEYGFRTKVDNREWGLHQHHIKQDLMEDVKKLEPELCVCLDMDEVFDLDMMREDFEKLFDVGDAIYFYILNLWNEGWNRKWSFWNIRAWRWSEDLRFCNKPLHCGLAPEWCYYFGSYSPYFVMHSGLKEKSDRHKKIERYEKYDPKAIYKSSTYYEALKSDYNEPLDTKMIKEAIIKEIGIQHKRKMSIVKPKKLFNVRRIIGGIDKGVVEIEENVLYETLNRNPQWINLGEVGKIDRGNIDLHCPICGVAMNSTEELLIHKQEHR